MLLQVCRKAGVADNKPRVLAERVKLWPGIAVMARPTILDTLFIASNSDNCEAIWNTGSENSSIVYKHQWTKRMLRNSICAEEKTSIILISTKLPAHSNAGLCQFWTNYADVNIKRRCHKHNKWSTLILCHKWKYIMEVVFNLCSKISPIHRCGS